MVKGRSSIESCETVECPQRGCKGFTLVEIMIVVAIIGLLVALALPSLSMARKQSQARRIMNDARQMNTAISEWALEKNKSDGDSINKKQAATYLKGSWENQDVLGNNYKFGQVGTNQITVSKKTKKALASAGIDWGPF
ncbi:MAG TPA: type II secretion system protein [Verrucomicrobiae bacterium]|nr:type II secretion system protein [Verrucomicrobiae bacterium]